MHELIDLYFVNKNTYMPLLHRPTFESNVADGLHLRNQGFGSTVLLVCAIGARYTEDPRVYLPGYENDPLARGWKWFNLIHNVKRTWLSSPTLYDLQVCCLLVQFMESTSAPHATWSIIGIGIRLAQDVGAHRKKVYNQQHRAEEELWKRAFWVLVLMDRALSAVTGRPCAMQDEDFDIDFLTECDDEFWMHSDPNLPFKQPPGKPSTVAFFNCSIRLSQILAFVQRTIYSSKKLKTMMGITGPEWEERIVRELDSALNRWLDTVPEHLRWNPSQEDDTFLNQSAHLYITYYQLQIFIHRPYLQSPHRKSSQTFPSLAICTNAARACIHILDHQYKRTGFLMFSDQTGLFVSGIVLLLNIWGSKRSSITIDVAKEMADVQKCMDLLKIAEKHWYFAGRGWDILHELAYVGDLPPLMQSPFPSRKRDRNGDVAGGAAANHTSRQDFTLRRSSGDNRPDDRSSSSALSIREQTRIALESERNVAGTYRASIIPASLHSLNLDAEVQTMFRPSGSNAQPGNIPQKYQTDPIAPTAHDASDPLLQNNSFSVQDPLLSALWLPQDQGNSNPTPPPDCSTMAPDSTGATAHLSIAQANSNIMGMHAPSSQGDAGGWSTPLTNDDLFSMLSSMPIGFEWNDWDAYIGTMSGMSDAQGSAGFEKMYSDKNDG
ncbi:hypothetical protein WOLCODRAFT_136368 [Wolfiporia cocos MD-104 SS10]|uniref:Xylanolytic transcriptional activator regulatory domain-containing protein n=1 Tax=Wolfiporia cocos (strain MD-104) TaxID=742152 RepID=A0A2H3JLL6_WOLCO|nr:hypothetical protein WOLCODRAFT_136368 [Wolfiporia cocos MD-104 SS10]